MLILVYRDSDRIFNWRGDCKAKIRRVKLELSRGFIDFWIVKNLQLEVCAQEFYWGVTLKSYRIFVRSLLRFLLRLLLDLHSYFLYYYYYFFKRYFRFLDVFSKSYRYNHKNWILKKWKFIVQAKNDQKFCKKKKCC